MRTKTLLKWLLPALLVGGFLGVVSLFSGLHSPTDAWALSMTTTDCKRCHGPDELTIVEWHHSISNANGLTCNQCHGFANDETGFQVVVERDCTVCHGPGWHTEPAGTNRDRHHNLSNANNFGCTHCHPLVPDAAGNFTVVVSRDCFICHTDGQKPWREVKWITNLPNTTSPDSAGTISDVTAAFQDSLHAESYLIENTATVDKALSIRFDKDPSTTSNVTIGLHVTAPATPSATVRIYPYLFDGTTVDTSVFVDYPVNTTSWVNFDVTSLANRMTGFTWMKFRVTVLSGNLSISEGSFNIVRAITTTPANQPPVANAGTDQSVFVNNAVAFSGVLSSDPDGSIASYMWNFGDGSVGDGASTTHAYTVAGTYLVSLNVTDNLGAIAEDFALVTVQTPTLPANQPPVAKAGPDLATTAGQPVSLSGAGSTDPDGTISSYSWNFGDGTSGSGASVTKVYGAPGTYTVTLTVTDNQNDLSTDTAIVTVTAPPLPNKPPTANAGLDVMGTTGQPISFSGAASTDSDGYIASYSWNYGDGTTATGVTGTKTYTQAGSYTVTLTVTDNTGAQATDTALVTVHNPVNKPPVAVAGPDIIATRGKSVTFSAAGSSDPDGTISSYKWYFGGESTSTGSSVTKTFSNTGTYTVTLTVTDNSGAKATDTVIVTVVQNQAPVANAGPDITATRGKTVNFSGSGSYDPDGSISYYSWNFGNGSTKSGSSVTTTYFNTGTYTVTLTVTDSYGAKATDTKVVTVVQNQPPIANAGPDVAAVAGQSVSFSGSGSSDPDGSISSYSWNLGDGTTKTGSSVTKTYSTAGTYTVTLTVTDSYGTTGTDTKIVTVTPNQPPVANAGADVTAVAGQSVSFSGSGSSDPDGTISSYSWSFGDGTTQTGANVTKTYSTAGNYTVTLTVADNFGKTSTDSAVVTVSAPPTPIYISADQAQAISSLSSRTSRDGYGSSTDITARFRDGILTDTFRVENDDSNYVVGMKANRDFGTATQIILRVYVSSISEGRTFRIYPYSSDGTTPNTTAYKEASVSARGWKEIDVTTIAAKMKGYGWMKFRVTVNDKSLYIGEGNFIIR